MDCPNTILLHGGIDMKPLQIIYNEEDVVVPFPLQSTRLSRAAVVEELLHRAISDMENHKLYSLVGYYTQELHDLPRC